MPEDRSKRSLISIVNPKRRSISRELTVGLVITIVVVSVITMSLGYFNASRRAKAELENKASEHIVSLTDILGIPLWNLDEKSIEGIGRSYAQNEFVQGLRIIDSWGKVYFQMEKEGDVPILHKTSDIFHEGEFVGHVEIFLTSSYYKGLSRQLLWSNSFTTIITLLSLVIMTGFLLRIFLRKPLDSLNEIVNSYASGAYDRSGYRVPYLEFQPFVDVLAQMGDKIKSQMTELRKHRDHLEKLVEERTAELEAFAYSVSHDLRAPLRAIDGFSQVLLEGHGDRLDKEGERVLNVIRDNTVRMGELIDDLLNFSRLGRKEVEKKDISMEKMTRDVFDELKVSAPEGKVKLHMKELPPAWGDESLIREVLANLLSNAIKFSKNQEVSVIEVGGKLENDENIYYVKDNGVGFDMKYVSKIFDVFQRLHSQEEFEGTGIGLAIVQRIIHRHGGRVWAEGKINKGATFYFTLPLR